jgi:hypothetical protein
MNDVGIPMQFAHSKSPMKLTLPKKSLLSFSSLFQLPSMSTTYLLKIWLPKELGRCFEHHTEQEFHSKVGGRRVALQPKLVDAGAAAPDGGWCVEVAASNGLAATGIWGVVVV